MNTVLASEFDKRIIIEKPVSSTTSVGQAITVWTTKATLWAKVQFRPDTRKDSNGVEVIGQVLIISIRKKTSVYTTDRLQYDGRTYRIDSAVPDDTDRYTIIRAYANDRS